MGTVRRVAAPELERVVLDALRARHPSHEDDRDLIETRLERIDLAPDRILLHLREDEAAEQESPITIPWRLPSRTRRRELIEAPDTPIRVRAMRAETRATPLGAIAQGRRWLDEIVAGTADPDSIAARESCTRRQVGGTISLAFLAPDIVQAAIDGRLPHGAGLRELMDPPAEWLRQRQRIGLT